MYAVVSSGGKQYRVEPGTELTVERLAGDAGTSITFDRVLLVGDGDTVTVGTPTVDGATVSGTVLGEALGPKLIVFKFKQKATYRRKNGHRQHLTRVRIDEISAGGTRSKGKAAKTEETEAAEARVEKADAGAATAEKPAKAASTRSRAAKSDASEVGTEEKKPATRKRASKPKAEAEE
jgi:large subunit ribosomal protein L21